MQIVILRKILNTALYVQWAYCNFRTLSIDIWQLKCQQRQTNKTKNAKLFFCKLFRIIKFFFLILVREATLEPNVASTNRNSSAFLLHTSMTFSNVAVFTIFSQTFFELIFATNVVETISCFIYQLSKNYCVYYVPEHLKYCSQINEYWLNKNGCVNIVLRNHITN